MQEMLIYGVSFDLVGKQPIVLLKTADGNKFLPIWIGHPEAAAILMKLQGASTPRPMTHDLLTDMLSQLDAQVTRICVTELRDNTFYATIAVDGHDVDARPSDAINLAVRVAAPILVAESVLEDVARGEHPTPPPPEEGWTSLSATGRRYARRASVLMIFRAHGSSSRWLIGRHAKIRRRLGMGPSLYEPIIRKPKGMHRRTFWRLRDQANGYQTASFADTLRFIEQRRRAA